MRYSREESEFDRAITFIDATFAVALTLLITSLDIQNRAKAFKSLSALYAALGPQFLAFLIAFTVIAGYWFGHHRMVASFAAIDDRTLVANLFLLAAIVLLPFATSAVGDPGVAELPRSSSRGWLPAWLLPLFFWCPCPLPISPRRTLPGCLGSRCL
ncbi:MAG: DUF1211 domain-containing protein [Actinobacteria bacterium]|nr:MAG: DUF1211 domain-containing protein [Actinomycetota bacterium]